MGLISFLFGKKPTYIEDSFFGRMHLMEHRRDATLSYFECMRNFDPIDGLIEICLYGSEGSSEKQIQFFKGIESQYDVVSNAVMPIIEDEFRNWKEDFTIVNFKKEFTPNYLVIPHCDKEPIIWEISFLSIHDVNHTFTIRLKDFEAFEIDIDG